MQQTFALTLLLLGACAGSPPTPTPPPALGGNSQGASYQIGSGSAVDLDSAAVDLRTRSNAALARNPRYANFDSPPSITSLILPGMPLDAIQRGVEGNVDVLISVDRNGRLDHVDVAKSPDAGLSQAVIDAIGQWSFQAPIRRGAPEPFKLAETFQFRLPPGATPAGQNEAHQNYPPPPTHAPSVNYTPAYTPMSPPTVPAGGAHR